MFFNQMNTIQIIGNLNKNNFQFNRIKKKIEYKLNNEPVVILKLGKFKKIKTLESFIKKLSFQMGDLIPQNSQNETASVVAKNKNTENDEEDQPSVMEVGLSEDKNYLLLE